MTRDEKDRLDDIWQAIKRVRETVGRAEEQTDRDESLERDAILYNLMVIGEAVKHLTEETKQGAPEIPWRRIAGLRDLLTHEYFRIEMDAIRKIVDRDLESLDRAIDALRKGRFGQP